jgi:hypothetical protein
MADETLLLLASEVRAKTLRLLQGVSDRDARWAPEGLANNILWHAGHSLWVVEHLGVSPATGKGLQLPDGWKELFAAGSKPTSDTQWPSLAQVIDRLQEQLTRLTAAIRASSDERLNQIIDPARNRTLRYCILHGLHDEAGHQGEIYLLKKLTARNK